MQISATRIKKTRPEELLALGVFGRGSRLRERIEILLERGREFSPRVSRVRVAASVLALAGCVIAGSLAPRLIAFAQATPQFDVASVKPDPWKGPPGSIGRIVISGTTLTSEHADLYALVMFAYDLREPVQLSGGPGWAAHGMIDTSDFFQVIAKATGDPPPATDQFRLMLQGLLPDRFKLEVHHMKKDMPVYNLLVGKNGPKLKESGADAKFSMATRSGKQSNRITAAHATMTNLLSQLYFAGRPVFDKTGLTGTYDFEIEFADASATDSSSPSLFTAVQAQLGLKLEPAVAPFDTIVIDHAEKPDPN